MSPTVDHLHGSGGDLCVTCLTALRGDVGGTHGTHLTGVTRGDAADLQA